MSSPKVTVVMPVYNGMPYLREAVESVLAQTYDDFKFLIVNDGSTDGSAEYLAGLDDPRIQVEHKENGGAGAARNHALALVDTPYLANFDADDICLPSRLEKQMAVMEANPDLVMLGTGFAFTVDGKHSGCAPPMPSTHEQIVKILQATGHAVCHTTIVVRTAAMKQLGGYRIQGVGLDWDIFHRMSEIGRVANLPEQLVLVRIHPKSNSWKSYAKAVRGNAYALACARCRQAGKAEPDPDTFYQEWEQQPALKRFTRALRCRSGGFFRNSVVYRLQGRHLRGTVCLALAALIYPPKLFIRLRRMVMRDGGQSGAQA